MSAVQALSLLMAGLIYVTDAKSDGVSNDVCETMDPSDGVKPQNTLCPYRLYLDRYEIYENERVVFTIEASPGRKIRGFIVQARSILQKPIGRFVVEESDIKTIDCSGGEQNTALEPIYHVQMDKVKMVWLPPMDYTGNCTFFTTVVEDEETFWVMQPAEKVLSIRAWGFRGFG